MMIGPDYDAISIPSKALFVKDSVSGHFLNVADEKDQSTLHFERKKK